MEQGFLNLLTLEGRREEGEEIVYIRSYVYSTAQNDFDDVRFE